MSTDANLINDPNVFKTVPGDTLGEFKVRARPFVTSDAFQLHVTRLCCANAPSRRANDGSLHMLWMVTYNHLTLSISFLVNKMADSGTRGRGGFGRGRGGDRGRGGRRGPRRGGRKDDDKEW
jgi:hypothetical protein